MTRKYTVQEIDALRRVVEDKYLWGSYSGALPTPGMLRGYDGAGSGIMSRQYKESEKNAAVEDMVRTHMLAGHTAEDLIASEGGGT